MVGSLLKTRTNQLNRVLLTEKTRILWAERAVTRTRISVKKKKKKKTATTHGGSY